MVTLTFDVESVGLHGEGFAVGWVLHKNGVETMSGSLACNPDKAKGTESSRQWIAENLPYIPPNLENPLEVRSAFWGVLSVAKDLAKAEAEELVILADCGWPVEARFLLDCVDDSLSREWEGPYPLHDLATFLLAYHANPTGHYERYWDEFPVHDPLADARQTARIFWELRRGIRPVIAQSEL